MNTNEASQDKVEKPHANFKTPHEIIADPALSKEEKVEALTELEQDARLLATAAAEGMTGGEPSNLREVLDAKEALERAGAAQASTAPGNPPPFVSHRCSTNRSTTMGSASSRSRTSPPFSSMNPMPVASRATRR
jgi:hypothetical protein